MIRFATLRQIADAWRRPLVASRAQLRFTPTRTRLERQASTFTIGGHDARSGEWRVAVQSKCFAIGAVTAMGVRSAHGCYKHRGPRPTHIGMAQYGAGRARDASLCSGDAMRPTVDARRPGLRLLLKQADATLAPRH
jgi:hypothetical protein